MDRVKAEAANTCIASLEKKLQKGEGERQALINETHQWKKEATQLRATVHTGHTLLAFYKLTAGVRGLKQRLALKFLYTWKTQVRAQQVHEEHCLAARTMIGVLRVHSFFLEGDLKRVRRAAAMQQWKGVIEEAQINNGDLESLKEKEELSVELCHSASPFTKSLYETRGKMLEMKENMPPPPKEGPAEIVLNDSIFASSSHDKTHLNNTTTLFEYSNPSFYQARVHLTSPSNISPAYPPLTTAHLAAAATSSF